MFVDASALVAIITEEDDWPDLAERLKQAKAPFTSPIAVYEAALAVGRIRGGDVQKGLFEVESFIRAAYMELRPVTIKETRGALVAHIHYGRGNHPARLNMGDCFAYACAAQAGVTLLYKGDDFTHTDLA